MNKKSVWTWLGAASCVVGITACVGPTASETSFPTLDYATTAEGSFPNVDNLRMLEPGMTKNQVYALVGSPHFHESVFHVRVWNYLFHFRTEGKAVSCQYQIQFDDQNLVKETRWKDEQCDSFAPAKIAADAASTEKAEKTQ